MFLYLMNITVCAHFFETYQTSSYSEEQTAFLRRPEVATPEVGAFVRN